MIKILFLINTLGGGGAERVLVNLVNNMDKSKFDITVETMFADGVNRCLLNDDVKYFCKNKLGIRGLSNIIEYIPSRLLYKYYIGKNDYDIIVAYMHGAPTKVVSGCKKSDVKKVTWLHFGNPHEGSFFSYWKNESMAINAYASMDVLVGVSQSVSNAFSDYTHINDKSVTLYNTNDTERILKMAECEVEFDKDIEKPLICTSGRLSNQKGFDRLINAAASLHNDGFDFKLIIMGSGPEEKNLSELLRKHNADEYICLSGFCENPYNIMSKSDFYISSSREEGLATVLTEALTLGLPVVSTDVSGAKEVLGENNEFGLVVENSEKGIYDGLKEFLTNSDKLNYYRSVAKKRAELFDTEHTVSKTEEFFESLVEKD